MIFSRKKSGNSSSQLPDSSTNTTTSPITHDNRPTAMRQRDHSPLVSRRSIGGESTATDGVGKLKLVHTTDGTLCGLASGSDSGSVPMGTLDDEDVSVLIFEEMGIFVVGIIDIREGSVAYFSFWYPANAKTF